MSNLTVATLNIRYQPDAIPDPSELPWSQRKAPLLESVLKVRPAIIGFQEPVGDVQKDDLVNGLKEHYDHVAEQIQAPDEFEYNVICWDRNVVELLDKTHFWLSETPDQPGTKSWGAKYSRMAIIGKFRLLLKSTNEEEDVYVFNTHLDWHSAESRYQGLTLAMQRVQAFVSSSATPATTVYCDHAAQVISQVAAQKENGTTQNGGVITTDDSISSPKTPPLVFIVGDLNEVPDGAAYDLITGNRYCSPSRTISSATSTGTGMMNGSVPKEPSNPTSDGQYYLDLRRELWLSSPERKLNPALKYIEDATPTWAELTIPGRKAIDPPMIADHIFLLDNGSLVLPGRLEEEKVASSNAGKWKIDGFEVVDNEFDLEDGTEGGNDDDNKQKMGNRYRYSDHRMLVASLSRS